MFNLSDSSTPVDSILAGPGLIQIVALPERLPRLAEDAEAGYSPTPDEDAWDLGFRLGRDGNEAAHDLGRPFADGLRLGKRARGIAMAHQSGYALGLTGAASRLDEYPFAPFALGAKLAYREGYDAGLEKYESERDAWLDWIEMDHNRMDEVFCGPAKTWHPAELARTVEVDRSAREE